MKTRRLIIVALVAFVLGAGAVWYIVDMRQDVLTVNENEGQPIQMAALTEKPDEVPITIESDIKNNAAPLPPYMMSALQWMANAQAPNGGYGAGLHSAQHVRDPHAVKTDPATTSLVGLAYVRTGSTHKSGPYQKQVSGILNHLLEHVEGLGKNPTTFTNQKGTQPQSKLGYNIDATFTSQFLTRMLEFTAQETQLNERIKNGVSICVQVIEAQQNDDGSIQGGTWAGVLQSSMANSALEQADNNGVKVNKDKLKRSRSYQRKNFDSKTGKVSTDAAAGIDLYAISSSNRASAMNARRAEKVIEKAKEEGKLEPNAEINSRNLQIAGLEDADAEEWAGDYTTNEATIQQLQRDDVLSGFGNNGGEEFISYMMTSESLVITGGDAWTSWNEKMNERLEKIQNQDGSWSGHHCITSPVFCTAAVIMTLATDRDVEYLAQINDQE